MSPTSRSTRWVAEEFDRRAPTYDRSDMHRWQAERAADLLAPEPQDRVLDLATGTGLGARACARLTGAPHRVVGIDVSRGMLRAAAEASSSTFVVADAAQLPFRASTFDRLLCVSAMPYFPDVARAAEEWRRVSRLGASLVFSGPSADGILSHRLAREAAAAHGIDLPDPHAALGTTESIAAAVSAWGWTLETTLELGYPDTLDNDAPTAFDQVVRYGFADVLSDLEPSLAAAVLDDFVVRYEATRRSGTGEHRTRFTRCTFRG